MVPSERNGMGDEGNWGESKRRQRGTEQRWVAPASSGFVSTSVWENQDISLIIGNKSPFVATASKWTFLATLTELDVFEGTGPRLILILLRLILFNRAVVVSPWLLKSAIDSPGQSISPR